jgi:hypothetical protein
MRKELAFIIGYLAISISIYGQDQPYKNVLKLNLPGIYVRSGVITYERVIRNKRSFEVGLAFEAPGSEYVSGGIGFFSAYRFYLSKSLVAPAGFYISPGLVYIYGGTNGSYVRKTSAIQLQGVAGYQWLIKQHFTLDVNAGVRIYSPEGFLDLTLGIGVGYRF